MRQAPHGPGRGRVPGPGPRDRHESARHRHGAGPVCPRHAQLSRGDDRVRPSSRYPTEAPCGSWVCRWPCCGSWLRSSPTTSPTSASSSGSSPPALLALLRCGPKLAALVVLVYWPVLRLLVGGRVRWRGLLPGAVVAGVGQAGCLRRRHPDGARRAAGDRAVLGAVVTGRVTSEPRPARRPVARRRDGRRSRLLEVVGVGLVFGVVDHQVLAVARNSRRRRPSAWSAACPAV